MSNSEKKSISTALESLKETFKNKDNNLVELKSVLIEDDVWVLKKRGSESVILTHNAIQKIADTAGIDKKVTYQILIQPSYQNNYQLSMEATITKGDEVVNEIGEVNRSNLNARGKNNPTNMAQKRAYDRAVLRMLGLQGLLSENELTEETDDKQMDNLTIDQQKKIAPIVSKILNAKTNAMLTAVQKEIKLTVKSYTEEELTHLRGQYKKQLATITKTF